MRENNGCSMVGHIVDIAKGSSRGRVPTKSGLISLRAVDAKNQP